MEPKGVEIPSHLPAEAAPSTVVSFPEGNKDVSDRQRAKNAVAQGVGLIKSKRDSGFFDAGDKVDAKKDAEKVLDQVGENNLDSDGLRAFFNSMPTIGGETAEVSKIAAEHMRVKVGGEGNARFLTLGEWRAELEAAQKLTGNPPDPKRIKELEDGVFAYSFPKATQENPESPNVLKEKLPEDKIISDQLSRLEEKLDKTGKLEGKEQQLLRILRIAEKSKSEARPVIQAQALKLLKESGTVGLDETFQKASQSVSQKISGGMDYLKEQGLSEGDIEIGLKMLGTEEAEKILSQWGKEFVGQELSKEEINELVATEKKKGLKDGVLLALLLAAIGPMELGKELVPMPGRN